MAPDAPLGTRYPGAMNPRLQAWSLAGLLAGCASITGPLPGFSTNGTCGVEKVTVLALGME